MRKEVDIFFDVVAMSAVIMCALRGFYIGDYIVACFMIFMALYVGQNISDKFTARDAAEGAL